MSDFDTTQLLRDWHRGERGALDELIQRDLTWIRERVSRRLGSELRAKADTQDYVQEAMIEVLTYCPRFTVANRDKFRALLTRIVENVLRDQNDFFRARRRAMNREVDLPRDSILEIGGGGHTSKRPEAIVQQKEEQAWLLLGLELVSDADRQIMLMREWDQLEFEAIGQRLGISANTARMRFNRAVARLADRVEEARVGKLANLDGDPD